jgi:hypothetical protein
MTDNHFPDSLILTSAITKTKSFTNSYLNKTISLHISWDTF